jgi:hypothetical protein
MPDSRTEADKDIERKRDKRSEAARVVIPEPLDIQRRESCLADPEKFLRTYFSPIFYNPFAEHHLAMIDAIYQRALTGGDKAVAAPRGDGKTQVTVGMAVFVMLATKIRFPVLIGNTSKKGGKLFRQLKYKFEARNKYPEFYGDFPEITACIAALEGAPQRAAKQHVDGQRTHITWQQDLIVMPSVPPQPWGDTDWGGKRLTFFGLDSAIRGEGFEEDRPDMAIIDDPETREVAFSPTDRHRDIEDMIDGDVAGLAGPNTTISRIVLTTIQNRSCYSFRVTDSKQKPAFAGERYPLLKTWPTSKAMWDEYIAIRQREKSDGLKDAPGATAFYLEHFDEMNEGAVLSNPHRFVSQLNDEGDPIEVDALQAFFNRVADWGLPRVLAELQQDPEEEEQVDSLKITSGLVMSRMSGLNRFELPKEEDVRIVCGIDVGKFFSHWCKVAIHGNATCHVIDYGVMETHGLSAQSETEAVQKALVTSLEQWRIDIQAENPPEFCLIDSGDYSDAVYEFVRRVGSPFAASKGWESARLVFTGESTPTRLFFEECRADFQAKERIWLYNLNSEYWKQQVHQRFVTSTRNEAGQLNDGSLSVWSTTDRKEHLSFAHHIVAEERREVFKEGKGLVKSWVKTNKNNHWLDATALALCAGGCLGLRVVPSPPKPAQSKSQKTASYTTEPKFRFGR